MHWFHLERGGGILTRRCAAAAQVGSAPTGAALWGRQRVFFVVRKKKPSLVDAVLVAASTMDLWVSLYRDLLCNFLLPIVAQSSSKHQMPLLLLNIFLLLSRIHYTSSQERNPFAIIISEKTHFMTTQLPTQEIRERFSFPCVFTSKFPPNAAKMRPQKCTQQEPQTRSFQSAKNVGGECGLHPIVQWHYKLCEERARDDRFRRRSSFF